MYSVLFQKPRAPWEIEAWSAFMEKRGPDSDAETLALFVEYLGDHSKTREDVKTRFEAIELDAYTNFRGKARISDQHVRNRKRTKHMNKNNGQKLMGQVAVVTGGSRGIGAAITTRLAANGASVAFTYAKGADADAAVVKEVERAGGKAIAIQADPSHRQRSPE